jgi:hypothetical protein
VVAGATAVLLALVSWSAIRFRGIGDYRRLLEKLVDVEAENSYSAFAVLRTIGLTEVVSQALVVASGIVLLLLAWRAARAIRLDERER